MEALYSDDGKRRIPAWKVDPSEQPPDWVLAKCDKKQLIFTTAPDEIYYLCALYEGATRADKGDYILKMVNGMVHVMKGARFERKFLTVDQYPLPVQYQPEFNHFE